MIELTKAEERPAPKVSYLEPEEENPMPTTLLRKKTAETPYLSHLETNKRAGQNASHLKRAGETQIPKEVRMKKAGQKVLQLKRATERQAPKQQHSEKTEDRPAGTFLTLH